MLGLELDDLTPQARRAYGSTASSRRASSSRTSSRSRRPATRTSQEGDVILEVNGAAVGSVDELQAQIEESAEGQVRPLLRPARRRARPGAEIPRGGEARMREDSAARASPAPALSSSPRPGAFAGRSLGSRGARAARRDAAAPPSKDAVFRSEIRPILVAHCAPCHEPGGKLYARLPFDDPAVLASHVPGREEAPEGRRPQGPSSAGSRWRRRLAGRRQLEARAASEADGRVAVDAESGSFFATLEELRCPREVVPVRADDAAAPVADDALVVRVALEGLAARAADHPLHLGARKARRRSSRPPRA